MNPHLVSYLITVPVMLLAIWMRVRRNFGPQRMQRGRLMLRVILLAAVLAGFAFLGIRHVPLLEGLLGGAVIGGLLGFAGIRLTRFERNATGDDLYIPNVWMGAAITALLIGRLAWRFLVLNNSTTPQVAPATPALGNSPLTFLVFGITMGYYLCYYLGLLIHHRRFEAAQASAAG